MSTKILIILLGFYGVFSLNVESIKNSFQQTVEKATTYTNERIEQAQKLHNDATDAIWELGDTVTLSIPPVLNTYVGEENVNMVKDLIPTEKLEKTAEQYSQIMMEANSGFMEKLTDAIEIAVKLAIYGPSSVDFLPDSIKSFLQNWKSPEEIAEEYLQTHGSQDAAVDAVFKDLLGGWKQRAKLFGIERVSGFIALFYRIYLRARFAAITAAIYGHDLDESQVLVNIFFVSLDIDATNQLKKQIKQKTKKIVMKKTFTHFKNTLLAGLQDRNPLNIFAKNLAKKMGMQALTSGAVFGLTQLFLDVNGPKDKAKNAFGRVSEENLEL